MVWDRVEFLLIQVPGQNSSHGVASMWHQGGFNQSVYWLIFKGWMKVKWDTDFNDQEIQGKEQNQMLVIVVSPLHVTSG